eukprot:CAMPEP_0202686338 /NCGR_PEP_ID=MMETSP1385-20130828/2154_1 /ASSEMBLY_ACC=CAM_ASM_000861 /TAXON_ID=933848 /ORGANISM="Elphidium margaritaceum" /LENGTH=592 /DNA_ID=CAMNT_0049340899 /DNA_START=9 /DNA_END=1787 /DNA_ORIENTATION=+
MSFWFRRNSTSKITITIKTTDGALSDTVEIYSNESVSTLKKSIDDKFQCDQQEQKLVFHGEILEDNKSVADYGIKHDSIVLLMKNPNKVAANKPTAPPQSNRNVYEKKNPFYHPGHSNPSSASSPPSQSPNKKDGDVDNGPYFDPVLNKLAQYHPELPLAMMEHSKEIGELIKDVNYRFDADSNTSAADDPNALSAQQQSAAAYYAYLSLASLSAVTSTVASSVYQNLPSKERVSASLQSLKKLMAHSKEEKAAIDRLVSLGFDKTESIEAYLACNKDEALAAVFMSQDNNKPTKGAPGAADNGFVDDDDDGEEDKEEEKGGASIDASMGFVHDQGHKKHNTKTSSTPKNELYEKTAIVNNSAYFKQFQRWMRMLFDDDESYYRYLLLFMKQKMADMECLDEIADDEEFLVNIGITHRLHRKRILKAIDMFVDNKKKFELWWNQTIRFQKYLTLFRKVGIWDLEELLLQIRSGQDVQLKIGIYNENDIVMICKHVEKLRTQQGMYANILATGSILAPPNNMMSFNPAADVPCGVQPPPPPSNPTYQSPYPNISNYSAPPAMDSDHEDMPAAYDAQQVDQDDESQKEGAITQM